MEKSSWIAPSTAAMGLLAGPILTSWSERLARVNDRSAAGPRGGRVSAWGTGLVSVSTAILLALVAARHAESLALAAWVWLVLTGVVLAVIDIRHRRLPHRMTAAMAVGGFLLLGATAALEGRWDQFATALLAGAAVLAVATAVQLLFPGHTGGGDTMLYGALALYLGWFGLGDLVLGLLLATTLTALLALAVWIRQRSMSATLPAGPTLIAGTVLAIAYGNGFPW